MMPPLPRFFAPGQYGTVDVSLRVNGIFSHSRNSLTLTIDHALQEVRVLKPISVIAGSVLTISGNDLSKNDTCTFGANTVALTTVISSTLLTCICPVMTVQSSVHVHINSAT